VRVVARARAGRGGLLTTPVYGLENHAQMLHHLTDDHDAIKVYVEVGQQADWLAPAAMAGAVPVGTGKAAA
jgi:hypothetical protein